MHLDALFDQAYHYIKMNQTTELHSLVNSHPRLLLLTHNASTLLIQAINERHLDCIKLLLQLGTSPNLPVYKQEQDTHGKTRTTIIATPLTTAVLRKELVIAQLLLEKGANVESACFGAPALHYVKSTEMAELLLKFGANLHSRITADYYFGDTRDSVLHSICDKTKVTFSLINLFIMNHHPVEIYNESHRTPLHLLMIESDHYLPAQLDPIIILFLMHGANPLTRDVHNLTPAEYKNAAARQLNREYADIAMPCVAYRQAQRTGTSFFATLPKNAIENIINQIPTTSITPEAKHAIVQRLLLNK